MSRKKARCPLCNSAKLDIHTGASRVIDGIDATFLRVFCRQCGKQANQDVPIPTIAIFRVHELTHRLVYEWRCDLGLEKHWSEEEQEA